MFEKIRKTIDNYKQDSRFWIIVVVFAICALMVALQFGIMYRFQSQNVIWEGVCKGGNLIQGQNGIIMKVNCPRHDEFKTDIADIILASKNEGKVFYCKKIEGNIMKDETWICVPPKGTE